jgi:UDP-glucose 4-epimerase
MTTLAANALTERRVFVSGGAGFIGSALVDRLVGEGARVTAYDNLSLGRREFLGGAIATGRCRLVEADLLDEPSLEKAIPGHDVVFHMAANSDISLGREQTDRDLQQGTLATFNVLDAMRRHGIHEIVLASTSAVYGEHPPQPIREDAGPLLPISLYGASKLASEGLVSAFSHNFGFRGWIFRFANVVGGRATHGAVFDFIRKLRQNPRELTVLGDGRQAKPYLLVDDCVDGMLFGWRNAAEPINVFNLAVEGATPVAEIAEMVRSEMGLPDARITFTNSERGWPGDVPQVRLDPSRLAGLGWRVRRSSRDAVRDGVRAALRDLSTT